MRARFIQTITILLLSLHVFGQQRPVDPSTYYTFKQLLDSCAYIGLDKNDYRYYQLFSGEIPAAPAETWKTTFIDAIFKYIKDVHQGHGISAEVSYNGIQGSSNADSLLSKDIYTITSANDLVAILQKWQPKTLAYTVLVNELRQQLRKGDSRKIKQLRKAINAERWLTHFGFPKYIVVNVASIHLNYYVADSLWLRMKIVAGKPATPTPRFAAYCNEVIFYPYWHVPKSIITKELLPACRRNPGVLNYMNIQVLNARGQVVSPYSIKWSQLSKNNFPYTLRQSTGCDNALGVVKFNLTSPFSVYMHDTNLKSAFKSAERYFSHGCIRIEKPIELASFLLPNRVDSAFLKACIKNQQPVIHSIATPVPVFVIYQTAAVNDTNAVSYYRDIYHQLGN